MSVTSGLDGDLARDEMQARIAPIRTSNIMKAVENESLSRRAKAKVPQMATQEQAKVRGNTLASNATLVAGSTSRGIARKDKEKVKAQAAASRQVRVQARIQKAKASLSHLPDARSASLGMKENARAVKIANMITPPKSAVSE